MPATMWRCARHFVLPYWVRRPLPCVAPGVLSIYLPHSLPIGFTKLDTAGKFWQPSAYSGHDPNAGYKRRGRRATNWRLFVRFSPSGNLPAVSSCRESRLIVASTTSKLSAPSVRIAPLANRGRQATDARGRGAVRSWATVRLCMVLHVYARVGAPRSTTRVASRHA